MALKSVSSFVLFITQISCLAHWRMDKNNAMRPSRILKVYSILAVFISFGIIVHSVVFKYRYYHGMHNVLVETIDTIQLLCVRGTHIIIVLEALCKFKQSSTLYNKLREVYGIFQCQLNVPFNAEITHSLLLKPLIYFAITYVSSIGFVVAVKIFWPDPHILEYWYAYVPPFIVCALRYYQIIITIDFIKDRFNELITLLHAINLNVTQQQQQQQQHHRTTNVGNMEFFLTSGGTPPSQSQQIHLTEQGQLRQLLIIRDLYNRLWELSTMVNACFGISLLISVGNDFVYITSNCYWIFLNFGHFTQSLRGILQMAAMAMISIPHLFNVLMLAMKCERTVQTTTGIALGLHRIEVDLSNENNNALIEQFSLQLLHQKLRFTAAGFFTIDCSLLYTIIGATTTYLIILIQFYVSDGGRRI